MNIPAEKMKRLLAFGAARQTMRERFPEYAFEIDRAIFSAGQKASSCADPHCHCQRMTFEKFHAAQNKFAAEDSAAARLTNEKP